MKTLQKIIAREYGFLDAKHKQGYNPRPFGYEKEYNEGWDERHFEPEDERESYKESLNHGWN